MEEYSIEYECENCKNKIWIDIPMGTSIKNHLKEIEKDLETEGFCSFTFTVCKGKEEGDDDDDDNADEVMPKVPFAESFRNN